MIQLRPADVRTAILAFDGGLDTVTPTLQIPPGFCRQAQNFEQDINGGYARIKGYERFDGRSAPSDADYAVLTCTITGSVAVGDVLTDDATTSYGTVIALPSGQAILTKITGNFSTGNIRVGGVIVGTCTGAQVVDGASTALLHATYKNLAADEYRDDIAAVPGSGNVLGVHLYNDVWYAWRNNAGGTAVDMYKSTTSGWTQVALGREISFTSGGTYEIVAGDTITGATSAATAVIVKVILTSGTWAGGDAAGRLFFASQTGTFQSENLNVGANLNVATIAGNSSAITFATVSGRFECVNYNFGGSGGTLKMYGCDGKNKGFEFDGTTLVQINTGMTTDTPTHVVAHKNHLFFSFGASVQHSGTATPYVWSAVLGAAELAMGDTVTGFVVQPGGSTSGSLAIFTRNNISILYGTSSADWELNTFDQQAGAYAYSMQHIGYTVMLDDRGLTSLATSQSYGNFSSATLSKRVQSWVKDKRSLVTASCLVREKNQYRIFFSDSAALYVTFDNGQVTGIMTQLFSHAVRCTGMGEMADGSEVICFGSTNGMVYMMEKGTSFDGGDIEAYLHLVFANFGSPRVLKRFFRGAFEVSGEGYAAFNAYYELGYATSNIDQPGVQTISNTFASVFWDSGVLFDAFVWDSTTLTPSEFDMTGMSENVSLKILSTGDYYPTFKISGAIVHYAPRRLMRNNP